jgi:hypothetical protein
MNHKAADCATGLIGIFAGADMLKNVSCANPTTAAHLGRWPAGCWHYVPWPCYTTPRWRRSNAFRAS